MQDTSEGKDLPAEVIGALCEGRKVEAIKILRVARNMDLKEAKEVVDQYVESDPVIKEKLHQASNGTGIGWVISFALICAGAYFIFVN